MASATHLRAQIERTLAHKIPSALTPMPRVVRELIPTGVAAVDQLLHGGFPLGAITEISGAECSGRTSLALSMLACSTHAENVCAWVDVSNSLNPESAAACGVDLSRLLWVRCGAERDVRQQLPNKFALEEKYFAPPPIKKGLHGGGHGPHPRTEARGLSEAISGLFDANSFAPRCAEAQRKPQRVPPNHPQKVQLPITHRTTVTAAAKPWTRIEQALRVTDLLLQAGGFRAIVLDMGGIAPEFSSRVPLATWFRYRAAAERTQTCIVLLTQNSCAKSSVGLLLRLHPATAVQHKPTVFTGMEHRVEVVRQRFGPAESNVIPLRKPVQNAHGALWQSRASWAGQ
jgi:recombination protein RecA